jgi:hypothetical protein
MLVREASYLGGQPLGFRASDRIILNPLSLGSGAPRRKCVTSKLSARASQPETPTIQTAETHIRIAFMNRFNTLGSPKSSV